MTHQRCQRNVFPVNDGDQPLYGKRKDPRLARLETQVYRCRKTAWIFFQRIQIENRSLRLLLTGPYGGDGHVIYRARRTFEAYPQDSSFRSGIFQ